MKKRDAALLMPYGVLPEVDGVEVLLEDLLLRELLVEPQRVLDLLDLAVHVALGGEDAVLHELLGDGGSTLLDAPGRDVGEEGAEHGAEVDAVVGPERAVLGGDDRVDDPHGKLVEGDVLAVLQTELVHLRDAVGPVHGGLLREVAQLRDGLHRVVVRGGDLDRARHQRGEAGADGEAADDDGEDQGFGARGR